MNEQLLLLEQPCAWCRGPLVASRRDARTCSKRCRQALHRARVRREGLAEADRVLRFGFADPPYPGNAKRCYGDHPDYHGEVDHAELLSVLATYDGWALCTSAAALPAVLAETVAQDLAVRVAAWDRGARPHERARILNGWEPVVYAGGRQIPGVRPPGRGRPA